MSADPGAVFSLLGHQRERLAPSVLASFAAHGAVAVLALFIARYAPTDGVNSGSAEPSAAAAASIVWLNEPGPGGGGGGGGNRMPEPVRKVESLGKEKVSLPVVMPPSVAATQVEPKDDPKPAAVQIPARTMGSGVTAAPGAVQGDSTSTLSLGPGSGGGAGTGSGTGMGPGAGPGLGPGSGGGTGGGSYGPGTGIEDPIVLREVKPQYTPEAMRAKIQGVVMVECVILADGSVGNAQVVRSLDHVFGLDEEAIKAARQWLFVPARRQGRPVAIAVRIELGFNLR